MQRIKKLQEHLEQILVVVDLQDIFYLTGMKLSKGMLIIHKSDARLFVDKRYIEKATLQKNVNSELSSPTNIKAFLQSIDDKEVVMDLDTITYQRFEEIHSQFFLTKRIKNTTCIKQMRFVKSPEEILLLQKSAKLNYEGFTFAKNLLREGVTEKEIAWEFEKYCRERGASRLAFEVIVAFGSNTSMPHYRPQEQKLKEGDPVLIDCGIVLNDYCSDLTRTFIYKGHDPTFDKIEKRVLEAYNLVLPHLRPQTKVCELDQIVRAFFERTEKTAKFQHNLGHSIGLDVHEYPVISSETDPELRLEEGSVLAIEPGLYDAGRFGYRYENVVVITKDGCELVNVE